MQLVDPRPPRPLPIRITPLIDVVFILLVFFMVTSHLLPTGMIELDNRSNGGTAHSGEPLPRIHLDETGQLWWQDRPWPLDTLIREVQRQGVDAITLDTADSVPLTEFTQTLSTLDRAGISAHWRREPTAEGGQP